MANNIIKSDDLDFNNGSYSSEEEQEVKYLTRTGSQSAWKQIQERL